MSRFRVPNHAAIHTARHFFEQTRPFVDDGSGRGVLEFHRRWAHVDPMSLAMIAAWAAWARRNGETLTAENAEKHVGYAARMKLFEQCGIDYGHSFAEHEHAGRFTPITCVQRHEHINGVLGDISTLLHLQGQPEALAAVQYCVSELLRNVLEHSGSEEGAYVCAQRFSRKAPRRVMITVADCGSGIATHLGRAYPQALSDDRVAIQLAMTPGITGAEAGMYGATENAGAGLFVTRCIAKASGGYFLVYSGDAAYRLRRRRRGERRDSLDLFPDPFDEPRHDLWKMPSNRWNGTVVTVEVVTDRISDFQAVFSWIRSKLPRRLRPARATRFTE